MMFASAGSKPIKEPHCLQSRYVINTLCKPEDKRKHAWLLVAATYYESMKKLGVLKDHHRL